MYLLHKILIFLSSSIYLSSLIFSVRKRRWMVKKKKKKNRRQVRLRVHTYMGLYENMLGIHPIPPLIHVPTDRQIRLLYPMYVCMLFLNRSIRLRSKYLVHGRYKLCVCFLIAGSVDTARGWVGKTTHAHHHATTTLKGDFGYMVHGYMFKILLYIHEYIRPSFLPSLRHAPTSTSSIITPSTPQYQQPP